MIRCSAGKLSWLEEPRLQIGHAFFGKAASLEEISAQFGLKVLCFPTQVHGTTILSVPDRAAGLVKLGEADGLVASRHWLAGGRGIAVVTADCLPVILLGQTTVALVHAGWRGLSAGILEQGVRLIEGSVSALIGPAAGPERYQVGSEVIEALGDTVVARPSGDRYLLDLAGTARLRLEQVGLKDIRQIPICTITEPSFNSYRREGSAAGRNITLVYQ